MTESPTPEDLKPDFGDIIENGWASEENPTRVGFFVREGRRTGKMNAGRYYEVTDGKGKFWELSPWGDHKITVRRAPPTPSTEALRVENERLRERGKKLEAALAPFAKAEYLGGTWYAMEQTYAAKTKFEINSTDFARARALLLNGGSDEG